MWIIFAFGSAIFAGLTAILSKIGIKNTDSNVATALRTIVVLIFSWLMVFIVGSQNTIPGISGYTLLFLVLSGFATGASWLCYFKALQIGDVNKVTPIDKSSTVLTMIMAFIFLGEEITVIKAAAIVLIGAGTYLMVMKKRRPNESPDTNVASVPQDSALAAPPDSSSSEHASASSEPASASSEPASTSSELALASVSQSAAGPKKAGYLWLIYAAGAAVFASLTSILGKIGSKASNPTSARQSGQ